LDKHEASVVEDSWFGAKLANSMLKRQEGGVEFHLKSAYLGKKSRSNNRMTSGRLNKSLCMKMWITQLREMEAILIRDEEVAFAASKFA
jgi:hypothetical protein